MTTSIRQSPSATGADKPRKQAAVSPTPVAIVGCGYVADQYMQTAAAHSDLAFRGAFDTHPENRDASCRVWGTPAYESLAELLADDDIQIVLNLTNPRSHFDVTAACLRAGKHVYSEKPLAMTPADAAALVRLARECDRRLAVAPSGLLSETAQTIWKTLNSGAIGTVRLVYANFDDGLIAPTLSPWTWKNRCGIPWPARDEFEVGCTYEHAGYVLTWLAAFFGPAREVTAFSSCQLPDKGIPVESMAPDFSVGCLTYDHGVVARVTCGLVAPRDKSLTIIGDKGTIFTENVRDETGPVYLRPWPPQGRLAGLEYRLNRIRGWAERRLPIVPSAGREWTLCRKVPLARAPVGHLVGSGKRVDFLRGPSELAAAIREDRPCRLSAELGQHITELIEVLQYPDRFGGRCTIQSTFDPIAPLEWTTRPVESVIKS